MLANEKYLMLLDMIARHKIKLSSAVKKFTSQSTFSFDYQMGHGAAICHRIRQTGNLKLKISQKKLYFQNSIHDTSPHVVHYDVYVFDNKSCNGRTAAIEEMEPTFQGSGELLRAKEREAMLSD
ncbi:hypothetical protein WUBG_06890 [Wuchereria bancrofti]|uniref:Uncharacterized protein n=1 Tax=Wuchereria bancrofti TaxID=6293 RepID=J9F4D8_WUCBA|nr:hypothetical protein WUBG_06890 [Wuchereria bancrofti]